MYSATVASSFGLSSVSKGSCAAPVDLDEVANDLSATRYVYSLTYTAQYCSGKLAGLRLGCLVAASTLFLLVAAPYEVHRHYRIALWICFALFSCYLAAHMAGALAHCSPGRIMPAARYAFRLQVRF